MSKGMRFQIMARWWNGKDYDITKKEVDTKNKVLGAIKLLMENTNPYQISITDMNTNLKVHK